MPFFKTTRDMLFQSYIQRLFSVDELIALLEENTATNPEYFITIVLSWPTWIIPNAKHTSL